MADIKIDDTVDITDVVCPVTFVKAKVALEELEDGEVLAVKMNDGEPVQNVPRSIKEEGHQILKLGVLRQFIGHGGRVDMAFDEGVVDHVLAVQELSFDVHLDVAVAQAVSILLSRFHAVTSV